MEEVVQRPPSRDLGPTPFLFERRSDLRHLTISQPVPLRNVSHSTTITSAAFAMADREPTRSLSPEEEARPDSEDEEELDPDLEDGDQVIARGWPRNHENLEKHGFRPVWTPRQGYPHRDIPADMKEQLDEDARMIGPLRSLAWLAGLDELVEAIDSDAYTIQDSVEIVPYGAGLMWPVERYIDEGKIPRRVAEKVLGWQYTFGLSQDTVRVQSRPPAGVAGKPTPFSLRDITGASRLQRPSGKILCMKIKSDKTREDLENEIRFCSEGHLDSRALWFRGLKIPVLESTLAFFIPQINASNRDNEFGPGMYTSNLLSESLSYLKGTSGAIMVFKDPDCYNARVWRPSGSEWTAFVTRWITPRPDNTKRPVPPGYNDADFIEGPTRYGCSGPHIVPSDRTQLVAVSYKGCEILRNSLHMIIFVDRR